MLDGVPVLDCEVGSWTVLVMVVVSLTLYGDVQNLILDPPTTLMLLVFALPIYVLRFRLCVSQFKACVLGLGLRFGF